MRFSFRGVSVGSKVLEIWTIFDHPLDNPWWVIARRFEIRAGDSEAVPMQDIKFGLTLAEVRRLLPPGLTCIGREQEDDPTVVESWV